AGDGAEDLVVGAVLLDDVDDELDRRGIANFRGDRGLALGGSGGEELVGVGAVLIDLVGVLGELFLAGIFVTGDINDRERAGERGADVGEGDFHVAAFTGRSAAGFIDAVVANAVGLRDVAFADADEQLFIVGRDGERRGIPARGDEAFDEALARD